MNYVPQMSHRSRRERREKIAQMFRDGKSLEEVVAVTGLGAGYLRSIGGRSARIANPRTPTGAKMDVLAALINTSDTMDEIGRRLGVTKQRVHQISAEAIAAGIALHPERKLYDPGRKKKPKGRRGEDVS